MSAFKKLSSEITLIHESLPSLIEEASNLVPSTILDYNERVKSIFVKIQEMKEEMEKTYKKSLVVDDTALYGEKMREKIKISYSLYKEIEETLEKILLGIQDTLAPVEALETRRKQELLNAKIEEERIEKERLIEIDRKNKLKEEEERIRKVQEEEMKEKERLKEMERLRKVREELEAMEAAKKKENEERVTFAKKLSIDDALFILRDRCENEAIYAKAIAILFELINNIADEPSNPQFRHIPKSNEKFQKDVGSIEGGLEVLFAVGFLEKKLTLPKPGLYYALEEPEMTEDPEFWLSWHEEIKGYAAKLGMIAEQLKRARR